MSDRKRIVITGLGAVTPLGHGITESFERLCRGENAIEWLDDFKKAGFPVHIGARVNNVEALMERFPEALRHRSRKLAYALSAMEEAHRSAGCPDLSGPRTGVYMGVETSRIAFELSYEIYRLSAGGGNAVDYRLFGEKCLGILDRDCIANKFPFFLPDYICSKYGILGPSMATSNACASSNFAIGEALRRIREGKIDAAVVGSADEMIDEYIVTGFSLLGALSEANSDPSSASRPFDRNRSGFVLGEGGAIMIVETLERAMARNAEVICELAGFGTSSDGEKITACNPRGAGLRSAMEMAVADAGMLPEEIDYVNAHATSTKLNDASETRAIKSMFGDHAKKLLVNSTKSMIGHTVAAAGAIEAAVTAMSVRAGVCHPTRNLDEPDDSFDLNYCAGGAVNADIRAAISNSCGFSGGNSCVVLKKFEGR